MDLLLLKLCRGGYVCESNMDEMRRVLSSEIILPWCGKDELKCVNIKKNGGLYTQCEKLKEGEYCNVCARSIEKNGGVAKYGTVSDREKCEIMEYVDPSSGKKPSSYSEYMKKNNLTMEEVEQYGKICGVVVPPCHFEENKISRGRPKKEVSVELENVEKKKRGRPKKEKQVVANGAGEELIASLMSLPTAELRCPDVALSESNIERKDEITNKEDSSIPSSESEAPKPPVDKSSADNDEKSEAPQPSADNASADKDKKSEAPKPHVDKDEKIEAPQPSADKDEKIEAPQPSADTADDDEDEETVVVKFDINGITYLKSQDNVIYDMNTHDALGVWNEETSEIDVLPEEDDEEE
jgi:hypothetical protein